MNIYLQVAGVQGGVKEMNHLGWIEVKSFSWPAEQPSMWGSVDPRTHELNIVKVYDISSPVLANAVAVGSQYDSAVLEVVEIDGRQSRLAQKYWLKEVTVTHYKLGATDPQTRLPSEHLTLEYKFLNSQNFR